MQFLQAFAAVFSKSSNAHNLEKKKETREKAKFIFSPFYRWEEN